MTGTSDPKFSLAAAGGMLELRLSQAGFNRFQFLAETGMLAVAVFHYLYTDAYGKDMIAYATGIFDVGRENSIPTWFSTMNLLLSALLLWIISHHARQVGEPAAWYWLALCLPLLAMSVDESARLHE
jgi:hypothetical protein